MRLWFWARAVRYLWRFDRKLERVLDGAMQRHRSACDAKWGT
jgi:hypothetical protein